MAKNTTEEIARLPVTFYLYSKKDNKLRKNDVKITSPYNVKSKGFENDDFKFQDIVSVVFEKGIYTLTLDKAGSELAYDQIKDFLSLMTVKGGILSKGSKDNGTYIKNGKTVSCKRNPWYITTQEIKEKSQETKTIEVIKEVKIQTIPRSFASQLDINQLHELCSSYQIEIPENIRLEGDVEDFKQRYLELLKDNLSD